MPWRGLVSSAAAEPGEDGHGTVATSLGGFLDRIAETIAQADATAN